MSRCVYPWEICADSNTAASNYYSVVKSHHKFMLASYMMQIAQFNFIASYFRNIEELLSSLSRITLLLAVAGEQGWWAPFNWLAFQAD